MLITDTLSNHSTVHPDKPAIISGDRTITYKELFIQVNQVASYLQDAKRNHPIGNDKKIAILMKNRVEFLYYFLGAAKAGWIAVPMDPKWSKKELEMALHQYEPQMVVIDESYVDRLPHFMNETQIMIANHEALNLTTDLSLDTLVDQEISDQQPFYMGFTSGTTGRPKGFIRSHRSWVKSFEGSQVEFGILPEEWVLVPGPFVHSTFLYAAVHALFIGATVVLLDKFSPLKVMDQITRFPVTVMYMVPTMFEALAAEIEEEKIKLEKNQIRMILSAGAKWSPESKQKVSCWFPQAHLFEFYGASELSFITVLGPEGNRLKPDSVGRPFHQVNLAIRDDEGNEVKVGEIGKLFVQSPFVFTGYYRNEEETKQVLQDDWATVHDLAWQDEDGYIYLVGREKNMIICGGLNVYPEEVENVLKRMPEIEEAVVFGKPDTYWGEKVIAVIQFKQGQDRKARDIQTNCRKYLAGYKCPRDIHVMKDIPYTSSGKVARKLLMDRLSGEALTGTTITGESK